MKIAVTLTISFLLAFIAGCASLRKEIYFVDAKNFPTEKGIADHGPGSYFAHRRTKISAEESLTVGVSVRNSAQGDYLIGVILPIIPVFWEPAYSFALKKENIQISCDAVYNSGNETHLDKVSDDTYRMNQKGVDAINRREENRL